MEELVEKAKKGDKNSFTEAILLIKDDLFNYAYMKVNNVEDANDILQETMIHAFKDINKLKENRYFKTWMIRILINECNKWFKKKYKQKKILNKLHSIDFDWSIDSIENKIDSELIFDSIISELKPIEQTIIILYFSNNYTKKEIAEILNMKYETVKTKLRRIELKIKTLRKGDKNE